jgi:hypothetical protein
MSDNWTTLWSAEYQLTDSDDGGGTPVTLEDVSEPSQTDLVPGGRASWTAQVTTSELIDLRLHVETDAGTVTDVQPVETIGSSVPVPLRAELPAESTEASVVIDARPAQR